MNFKFVCGEAGILLWFSILLASLFILESLSDWLEGGLLGKVNRVHHCSLFKPRISQNCFGCPLYYRPFQRWHWPNLARMLLLLMSTADWGSPLPLPRPSVFTSPLRFSRPTTDGCELQPLLPRFSAFLGHYLEYPTNWKQLEISCPLLLHESRQVERLKMTIRWLQKQHQHHCNCPWIVPSFDVFSSMYIWARIVFIIGTGSC